MTELVVSIGFVTVALAIVGATRRITRALNSVETAILQVAMQIELICEEEES